MIFKRTLIIISAIICTSTQVYAFDAYDEPTFGSNSAYILTPIDKSEVTEDSITTYTYVNGKLVPHYYNITVKDNLAGNPRFTNSGFYDLNNDGVADDIIGNSINNNHINSSYAAGGGIMNSGTIGNVKGHYVDNSAISSSGFASGGAIINYSGTNTIGDITGDFVNNTAVSTNTSSDENRNLATGGAIFNNDNGTIGNITGDFVSNSAVSTAGSALGGAISNNAGSKIKSISGNFIKNTTTAKNFQSSGGAIFNSQIRADITESGFIDSISGNFIGNSAVAEGSNSTSFAQGGAISNDGQMNSIEGVFEENFVSSKTSQAVGGAICSIGKVASIKGTFINNYAENTDAFAMGGAVALRNETDTVKADFIGNHAYSSGTIYASAGALVTTNNVKNVEGNFISNYTETVNSALSSGGALHNTGTIENLKSNFIGNYSKSTDNNSVGGAVYNGGNIKNLSGNFSENYTYASNSNVAGGAIYNTSGASINITNANFINNYGETAKEDGVVRGGAVYNGGEITFNADNAESIFSGNKAVTKNSTEQNAIYSGENGVVTLNAVNNGKFTFDDEIDGKAGYKLNIKGDTTGSVNFNNSIKNASINHESVVSNFDDAYMLNNNNALTMNSGTMNINKLSLTPLNFTNFSINGGTININNVDVNLEDKVMGRITADTYSASSGGNISVNSMNLLNDGIETITDVPFADTTFSEYVSSPVNKAYSKLYAYDVMYNKENGNFTFSRPGGADGFSPAVTANPAASQAGGYATQTETFKYVFEHADAFTQLPAMERFALLNQNKYAINSNEVNFSSLDTELHNRGVWLRPYTAFENIPLKNGPKVDTITYGTLLGFDSDFHEMKNGWSNVFTGYIGYNGSSQSYSGVDTIQNGGLIGLTETFYKGNFFTALTASAGASVGQTTSPQGKDDFTMLLAGIGSKTGYNFEFKEGRFIIQPIMFMSYTFVNTFDYKTAGGVSIDSDPLHAIQLNPSVKFIGNLKGGWQPYASVGMVWNVLDKTKVTANDVRLPEMSVKPYVEYGVGIQRRWADKYTAFLQAMLRNGGRNGISLTSGFRMMLGEPKTREKHEIKTL